MPPLIFFSSFSTIGGGSYTTTAERDIFLLMKADTPHYFQHGAMERGAACLSFSLARSDEVYHTLHESATVTPFIFVYSPLLCFVARLNGECRAPSPEKPVTIATEASIFHATTLPRPERHTTFYLVIAGRMGVNECR